MSKDAIRKQRILDYLDNLHRQLQDIRSIPVAGEEFFLDRGNVVQIKAIKYSLACAIQDVTRICAHIASALSLESQGERVGGHFGAWGGRDPSQRPGGKDQGNAGLQK